jgi:hypothetical protein
MQPVTSALRGTQNPIALREQRLVGESACISRGDASVGTEAPHYSGQRGADSPARTPNRDQLHAISGSFPYSIGLIAIRTARNPAQILPRFHGDFSACGTETAERRATVHRFRRNPVNRLANGFGLTVESRPSAIQPRLAVVTLRKVVSARVADHVDPTASTPGAHAALAADPEIARRAVRCSCYPRAHVRARLCQDAGDLAKQFPRGLAEPDAIGLRRPLPPVVGILRRLLRGRFPVRKYRRAAGGVRQIRVRVSGWRTGPRWLVCLAALL